MTPDTAALRALADALPDSLHRRPWTWAAGRIGGYPQHVLSVGNVLIIAETYDEPDAGATTAPYIAALDPATVIALCDKADRLDRLTDALRELCDKWKDDRAWAPEEDLAALLDRYDPEETP